MAYELWHELTLSTGAALGLLGFFRTLEQRTDSQFLEVGARLSSTHSPMLRATACSELPRFWAYRRLGVLWRPYQAQALAFAINGLKGEGEHRFVRQALADALRAMLRAVPEATELRNLVGADLDELILYAFPFSRCDLTEAKLQRCDLGLSTFTGSKLWRATFAHSKLTQCRFDDTQAWDADFTHANLEGASLRGLEANPRTSFRHARLVRVDFRGARLNGAELASADLLGADLRDVEGLDPDQVLCAVNWEGASLDPALRHTLSSRR